MQQLLTTELLDFALELTDIAAKISGSNFRSKLEIKSKDGNYPVTKIDLEIEEEIRHVIKERYPEHGVIGEEFANVGVEKEFVWVIDPIDGTVAFTTGKPTYSTLIALLRNNVPLIGVIDQPILKERFIGVYKDGASLNGTKLQTSNCNDFKMARLNATTPYMFKTAFEKNAFARLQQKVKVTSFGGDSYAYGLLAAGHIDIIMEADLKYYDVASVIPIIEESGGVITNWQGEHIDKDFNGQCLVTANKTLHKLILEIIGE